jgi:hypothetical protein
MMAGRSVGSALATRRQQAQLFGTCTVALAVWGRTAKTEEELDRGLWITAAATAVDAKRDVS